MQFGGSGDGDLPQIRCEQGVCPKVCEELELSSTVHRVPGFLLTCCHDIWISGLSRNSQLYTLVVTGAHGPQNDAVQSHALPTALLGTEHALRLWSLEDPPGLYGMWEP